MSREAFCFVFIASLSTSICIKMMNIFLPYLQEVTGITMAAFQEVSMPLLRYKVGNVAWNTNIQAIHSCQNQIWPAECAKAQTCNYVFSVHDDLQISTQQN